MSRQALPPLPGAIKAIQRQVLIASFAGLLLMAISLVWRLPNAYYWYAIGIPLSAVIAFCGFRGIWRIDKLITQAKQQDGRLCGNCLYPIPDHQAGEWVCPECGDHRPISETKAMWADARIDFRR